MALGQIWSVALDGVVGIPVQVECDVSEGVPGVAIVGLPDTSISEARDRVRAALGNSGLPWKPKKVTINLSPAHVRKQGTGFDLAMAMAMAVAMGKVAPQQVSGTAFVGELGLDGRLHAVRGALPALVAASVSGFRRIVLPLGNRGEAGIPFGPPGGLEVLCAPSLRDLIAHLTGADSDVVVAARVEPPDSDPPPDLIDVRGQHLGRRAMEVAAAGGHHVLLQGPPGAGKTMLAQRLPGLLPVLDDDQALEVTAIHSLAGTLTERRPMVRHAPFESPHHSATAVAIIGGGSGLIRPGAVSRAHCGVLFLDEAPEFPRHVLDQLRQPLESGSVTVHRARAVTTFPARFQLVLAANPCPCASPAGDQACVCTSVVRRRYVARLSGPLVDRIDLTVQLNAPERALLLDHTEGAEESSAPVAARVLAARDAAAARWGGPRRLTNGEVPGRLLRQTWAPQGEARGMLEHAYERGLISGRGYERTLRVAWTIADLAGQQRPSVAEVAAALGMRVRHASLAA